MLRDGCLSVRSLIGIRPCTIIKSQFLLNKGSLLFDYVYPARTNPLVLSCSRSFSYVTDFWNHQIISKCVSVRRKDSGSTGRWIEYFCNRVDGRSRIRILDLANTLFC